MRISDWSSDVCSSDLPLTSVIRPLRPRLEGIRRRRRTAAGVVMKADPRARRDITSRRNTGIVLRKEVIQPQVPLRLPCYDFTPVADLTVVGCPPFGLAHRLRVKPTPMV